MPESPKNKALQRLERQTLFVTVKKIVKESFLDGLLREIFLPKRVDNMLKARIRISLQEALINAAVHGVLGIPSNFNSTNSYFEFIDTINSKIAEPGISEREIRIEINHNNDLMEISIFTDRNVNYFKRSESNELVQITPHGRGIKIIEEFADEVFFATDHGSITMRFYL